MVPGKRLQRLRELLQKFSVRCKVIFEQHQECEATRQELEKMIDELERDSPTDQSR